MDDLNPVGLFDSGLGGLSVLRRVRARLPAENLLYLADRAYLPYGDKSNDQIRARCEHVAEFLLAQGAKALVAACNTATAAAIDSLRAHYTVPIIGIEPAIKPAATGSRSGAVAILATATTLQSARYAELLSRHGSYVRVLNQPCPGLVEQIETGDFAGPATRQMLEHFIQPLLADGIDHLVLGCTHYPFVAPLIRDICGCGVTVIDPSDAVAERLAGQLARHGLAVSAGHGTLRCFSTGDPPDPALAKSLEVDAVFAAVDDQTVPWQEVAPV